MEGKYVCTHDGRQPILSYTDHYHAETAVAQKQMGMDELFVRFRFPLFCPNLALSIWMLSPRSQEAWWSLLGLLHT